jgi:cytochrome c peroxidase
MLNPNLPEPELLKAVLQPLLEDFQYWFGRSRTLLEAEQIPFLSREEQAALLARVQQAQQEVSVTQMLLQATGGEAGVETSVLMVWHHLVTECWQVAIRFRTSQSS